MSIKNSNDTIGNRTHDLSAFSAVPQPTAPPRAYIYIYIYRYIYIFMYTHIYVYIHIYMAHLANKLKRVQLKVNTG
jgi:hypothetical protein